MNSKEIIDAGAATPANSINDYASNLHHSNISSDTSFKEADAFLKLLDPSAASFTFQTFDDNVDVRSLSLARVLHGSLEKHWGTLVALNKKGAGVFVTVNKTDGKGRKKENIVGIRAIWIEADNGIAPDLPITPHIKVETSPGNYHLYFLTLGPSSEDLDTVAEVQNVMVDKYMSDANAKDISRVLRLPGFLHQKICAKKSQIGTQHLVRVIHATNEVPREWGVLKSIFKSNKSTSNKKPSVFHVPQQMEVIPFRLIDRVLGALEYLDPDESYNSWLESGMALHNSLPSDIGFKIWDEWSKNGNEYNSRECEAKWLTFSSNSGVT